jgi:hypothetical protein
MHLRVQVKIPSCLLATEIHCTDERSYKADRVRTCAGTLPRGISNIHLALAPDLHCESNILSAGSDNRPVPGSSKLTILHLDVHNKTAIPRQRSG